MSQGDALFHELDGYIEAVIKNIAANERRRLSRQLAAGLRKRQQQRITRQQNPDGSPFQPRKRRHRRTQAGVRFLWNGEARELRNWSGATGRNGHRITGFDVDRGALRSFLRADIEGYISINTSRSDRPVSFKEKMFPKLRTVRFLRTETSPNSAAVGFSGRAAQIARAHQFGETETIGNSHIRYPVRELLGLTSSDMDWLADSIVDFIDASPA